MKHGHEVIPNNTASLIADERIKIPFDNNGSAAPISIAKK